MYLKKNACILLTVFLLLTWSGCIEPLDTELEKPSIELVSPVPCDTLWFGESYPLSIAMTDNIELGNLSMDIHHNFGHHDHGSHASCSFDPVKDPVNPFLDNWLFSLPPGNTTYELDTLINFPAMDGDGNTFDPGDYHFHIYLTDADGYQVFTTMDVKLLNR